uniref:Peptidase S1 domain-containing protein n=1 Tax=Anopheles minimus TaxID=112268 RepID=A0A182WLP6_9DIPT
MKLLTVAVLVLIAQVFDIAASHTNPFDVIRGCKQHDNVGSYDASLTYFPTSSLLNVGYAVNSKYFKIGILGPNDGIIRYGRTMFPYDKEVVEIVAEFKTPNLLSQFRPTMFLVEVFYNGTVQVRIGGQNHPFLSFSDDRRIPANYIAFTKWDKEFVKLNRRSYITTDMKLLAVITIVLFVQVLDVPATHTNSFDVIRGCRQYENVGSYDASLKYFPTSSLLNVGRTDESTYFKIAILGPNDGIIRLGKFLFPYDTDVLEIILGGWGNTKSAGKRQHRKASNHCTDTQLVEVQTPNLMSQLHPTMFVLEMFHNGTVQVRIDGQDHPFLSFIDDKRIPANYMVFTKWNKDVIFFYDCPLTNVDTLSNSLLVNCTTVKQPLVLPVLKIASKFTHQNRHEAVVSRSDCSVCSIIGSYGIAHEFIRCLLHVGHTDYSKYFKIAVLGTNDGIIRYGQSMFPHGKVVMEIVIRGCKLHDNARNYDTVLKYFPTLSLLHVGRTSNSKYFKIGILGPNNGIIRYGESMFPYDKEVMEIAIKGCLQFDDVPGYNDTPVYFATNTFRNVGRTSNSRYFRIGIVGANDGHIRFGRSAFPFDEEVVELVISGWSNTQSVARRQLRRRNQSFNNQLLKEASTPRLLHRSRPLVFRLEVFDNGRVQLTKDGERRPFFEYSDSQNAIPPDYMGFFKWDVNLIYFYDCPLNDGSTGTAGEDRAFVAIMAGLSCSGCLALFASVVLLLQASAQRCGQVQVLKQGLIFGGTSSTAGMWPWHVALFHRESVTRTSYKCGGTIINRDTILTAVHGCLQYDIVPEYNNVSLEYFATDTFKHVGRTHNSKYIRVGMVGPTDGIIRFGKHRFPYGEIVTEIYLSGQLEQHSEINRQSRTSISEYTNTLIKSQLTPDVLSNTRPMMFRLEVFDNGNVMLTKDGEKRAFMEFNDDNSRLDLDYIAFAKWNHDAFYYYDCPLHTDSNRIDDTVLLRCKLA